MPLARVEDIKTKVGSHVGTSPWIEITQKDIDVFADVTGDRQYIHVDPEAAKESPFGGTIAHGFLTLSLLSQMAESSMYLPEDMKMLVNYGFDKVRFITPVKTGKRVRGHFTLASMEEKRPGQWQVMHQVTIEIEGEERPALQADWIGFVFI